MIRVKPFCGLRPDKELYGKVVSPPYDVLTDSEYRKTAEENEYSFVHIIRPEVDFPRGTNMYGEDIYKKGRENLLKFIEKKYLVRDLKPVFYVYKQTMGDHSQWGFVAGVNVYDYDAGLVKKHENTRQDKEEDRIKHIDCMNAHTGPSFLVYKDSDELTSILNETVLADPEISIKTEDGITHELWLISSDEVINNIVEGFKKLEALYIADGHHRTKASVSVALRRDGNVEPQIYREHDYFMSVIFPEHMLKILPYNRVVRDLNGLTNDRFIDGLKKSFDVEVVELPVVNEGFSPDKSGDIGMYLSGKWYKLSIKKSIEVKTDPVSSLDVSVLQDLVLTPMLNIKNPRVDKRIGFIGGIRGAGYLQKLVDSQEYAAAFTMFPTTMEQLLSVADAGLLMPPKSTWFEPKLRSGMVIHEL